MLTVDLKKADIGPGHRVLDLGCGGGRHAFACLVSGASVVAIDADQSEVETVNNTVSAMRETNEVGTVSSAVAVASAFALPIVDGAFDRIIIAEVLEHLIDDDAAIAELVRVLEPGGVLAVSVPRSGPERVNWALSADYHNTPGGHIRIYRRRQLIAKIENVGLTKIDSHHAHSLHSPYWWLKCAVGVKNEKNPLVRAYHALLVWEIMKRPKIMTTLDRLLNPFIGKSLVLYFVKPT